MDAWSPDQLRKMQLGGNDTLNNFLSKYSVDKFTEIKDKYSSQAAEVRAPNTGLLYALTFMGSAKLLLPGMHGMPIVASMACHMLGHPSRVCSNGVIARTLECPNLCISCVPCVPVMSEVPDIPQYCCLGMRHLQATLLRCLVLTLCRQSMQRHTLIRALISASEERKLGHLQVH